MPRKIPSPFYFFYLIVALIGNLSAQQTENEEVLFYGETTGGNFGTRILNLETKQARWWFQLVTGARVSPNGREVAYLFNQGGVHLADLNGQNGRNIYQTSTAGNLFWSSDGQRIAFLERVANDQPPPALKWVITIISREGEHLKSIDLNMTPNGGYAWSPDDKYFAVAGTSSNPDHYICTINGFPCPPGNETINDSIFLIDVETGTLEPLIKSVSSRTGASGSDNTRYLDPVWSPNSNSIAAYEAKWGGNGTTAYYENNLVTIPLNSRTPDTVIAAKTTGPQGGSVAQPPQRTPKAWSLDGSEIVYYEGQLGDGAEPGTYITKLSGQSRKIYDGSSGHTQWTILNPGPKLEIDVLPDQPNHGVDKELEIQFTVTHRGDSPATYTFEGDLFTQNPEPEDDVTPVVTLGEFETPEPFVLSEEDPEWTFSIPAITEKPGVLTLLSAVNVQPAEGEPSTLEDDVKIIVNPIAATVTITNEEHLLNLTAETEWSEKAMQLNDARRVAELEPYENLIEVILDIENAGEDTLENLNIPGALDVLSLIKSIDLENPGVPLTPIQLFLPDGSEIDLTVSNDDTTLEDFDLEPDETINFTWLLDAYDVDPDPLVDNSAELEFKALILAGLKEETIQSLVVEEFSVIDKPLLEWGINLVKSGANFLSGESIEVEGFLNNISADDGGEGQTLVAALVALTDGNLGGGLMRDPEISIPGGQILELFELPPEGEKKTQTLTAVFQSLPALIDSNGEIEYEVRLWIKKNEDELEEAHARKRLRDDLQKTLAVSLASNSTLFYAQPIQQVAGLPAFLNKLDKNSIANLAAAGSDLVDYLFNANEELGYLNRSIAAQDIDLKRKIYNALELDGEELERVLGQGFEHYQTLAKFNILPGDTLLNRSEYIEESRKALDSLIGLTPAEKKALNEIRDDFAIYQENLLEITTPQYLWMSASRALAQEAMDPNSFANRSLKENGEQLSKSLQQRIEAARQNPGIQAITEIFEPGDVLGASSLFSTYGLSIYQYQQLQDAAENNDAIISFRSATKEARQLLETANAIPPPYQWPLLAANEVDVLFLGYEESDLGKVVLMRPPGEILGKTGEELSTAVTNYVDQLAATKTELQNNVVLLSEVRSRLLARVQEWSGLLLQQTVDDAKALHLIPANYNPNFDSIKGALRDNARELGADKIYQFTTEELPEKIDEVTGEARKRWNLFWSDPVEPENKKPLVSPIEFLPPLDPDGHIIKDENRLRQIYAQLSVIPGFNNIAPHAFGKDQALKFWQTCCGDEPVITIAPNGDQLPVVAFLRESLSVLQSGTNTSLLQLVPPTGPPGPDILLASPTVINAVREHVSDEFVFLEGALYQAKVDLGFEKSFNANGWLESLQEYLTPYIPFLPTLLAELLGEDVAEFSRDEDAPIIQPTGEYDEEGNPLLQIWDEVSGWFPISVQDALALGEAGKADFAPMTTLPEGGEAGDTRVEITPQDVLGALGDFFQPGDRVVINPGGDNQEITTVRGEGSLIFTTPLKYDHSNGQLIAYLGPDDSDVDNDGLTGTEEAQAGTDSENPDTDGDGVNDGTEIDQGQDPLTPNSGYRIIKVDTRDGDSISSFTFNIPANHRYELQVSTTLNADNWLTIETGNTADLPSIQSIESLNFFPDSDRIFYRILIIPE